MHGPNRVPRHMWGVRFPPQGCRGGQPHETDGGSMIRSSKTWQAVALTAVAGLALSACGTTDTDDGDASGEDCNFKIGVMGALSGANASIVLPSVDGAELALKQWENDECEVTIEKFDT